MPPYRLVIFDLDGTLTPGANASGSGRWLPGRLDGLRALAAAGVHLAIATNQGGVAIGLANEADVRRKVGAVAAAVRPPMHVEICTAAPRSNDFRRKPNPGMLLAAMAHFGVTPAQTLFVGDMETDREAARNAGVAYMDTDDFFGRLERELGREVA